MMVDADLERLAPRGFARGTGGPLASAEHFHDTTRTSSIRIRAKGLRIGVIGLGYVGLPLAVEFAKAGFDVTGFDVDPAKVEHVNTGYTYIPDVEAGEIEAVVRAGRLRATTDMSRLARHGRDRHLRADAAAQDQGPGPLVRRAGGRRRRGGPARRQARHPRIDDLSGHDRRGGAAEARERAGSRPTTTSTSRSRPSASTRAIRSSRRRTSRRSSAGWARRARSWRRRSTARSSAGGARQLDARRRDGEAAREHVPRGEHRPRERDRADVAQPRASTSGR